MALGVEKNAYFGMRNRNRIKTRLRSRVEVRSEDEGCQGSWHPGIVVARQRQGRFINYDVKYDSILTDDGSDHLLDTIRVCLLADDGDFSNANQLKSRGVIRPPPPPTQFGEWNLTYGLCVDVFYMDSWWEGVIFDQEDGSKERNIFFPDLGDEMVTHIDSLRITQDWDEVTEIWQCRGTWLFLESLEEYEQRHYLPVSVKQLWYDLRGKECFQKLREWTSPVKALWKELVLEAINDNLKLGVDHLSQVIGRSVGLEKFGRPVNDVSLLPEAMAPVQNMSDGNANALLHQTLTVQSTQEGSDMDKTLSPQPIGISDANMQIESIVVQFQDKAMCALPQTLLVTPSKPDLTSAVGTTSREEGSFSFDSGKTNRKCTISMRRGRDWLPAGPDLIPGAEFCPDAVLKYAHVGDKGHRNGVMTDVRKHLLFLNWKIEFLREKTNMIRLRYTSPNGKCYFSLRQVCLDLSKPDSDISSTHPCDGQRSLHTNLNDLLSSPLSEQLPGCKDPDYCPSAPVSSQSHMLVIHPEYCPQAIADWAKFGYEERLKSKIDKTKVDDMILRARKHLAYLGWQFAYRYRNGKRELTYTPPRGTWTNSLRKACIQAIKRDSGANAFTSRHIQKNINAPAVRKSQRKRKKELYLASSLVETGANLRRGKTLRSLVELKNKKLAKPKSTRRSSKRVRGSVVTDASPRNVLSWLIKNNVITESEKVQYWDKRHNHLTAEGKVTKDGGIECNCCGKVYSISPFAVHARSKYHRPTASIFLEDGRFLYEYPRPAASIFLKDGRSIFDCQKEMYIMSFTYFKAEPLDNDDVICSVCHYGGDLILCDRCPSSFHICCVGMQVVPEGSWFCPSCRCRICGEGKLKKENENELDAIRSCAQCERIYDAACLSDKGTDALKYHPEETWFCSKECEAIFLGLRKLLGKPIPVGLDNLTWTLVKSLQSDTPSADASDAEVETHSKLSIALDVMHECFLPVEDPHTGRDLVEDVIFGRGSNLKRLNFRGFYTVLLERDENLIAVGTVRIYGTKVAEIPLVGTRFRYRRQGMCSILMNLLEKKLMELGVQRLVLPAVPSVLNTWTGSFGFSKMTDSERLQIVDYTFLDFQGAVMCHKLLRKAPFVEFNQPRDIQPIPHAENFVQSENIDSESSGALSELFEADQIQEGQIIIGGPESTAGSSSQGGNGKDGILTVSQPTRNENEPRVSEPRQECLVVDSSFKKEFKDDAEASTTCNEGTRLNGALKRYKRRKTGSYITLNSQPDKLNNVSMHQNEPCNCSLSI